MGKITNRDRLLSEGLKVVHEHGFAGASVRDIVQAAGVPQGSFTNHFVSKEAFGLEILDLYYAQVRALAAATLRNDAVHPLKRLRAYIDANKSKMCENSMKKGCMLGNFSAEASEENEGLRARLVEMFAETQGALAYCLKAAIKTGDVAKTLKADEVALFIMSSLQGAILLAKAQRSAAPVDGFEKILFSTILIK